MSEDIKKIEDILNSTIRPHIQNDGGDLSIVSYENNVLTVSYKGACVGCPMATRGTLQAIQRILQEQFNSDLTVEIAQ